MIDLIDTIITRNRIVVINEFKAQNMMVSYSRWGVLIDEPVSLCKYQSSLSVKERQYYVFYNYNLKFNSRVKEDAIRFTNNMVDALELPQKVKNRMKENLEKVW